MSFLAKSGLLLANVYDYGAKGDGATDDTAAIQAAIDDVIATSNLGGVFFPPGNFQVSLTGLTVVAASNFRMLGAGQNVTSLQFIAEDQGGVPRTLVALSGGCSFVEISGLDLDGNQANLTDADDQSILLDIGDSTDVECHDCMMQNTAGRYVILGDNVTLGRRLNFRDIRIPNQIGPCFVARGVQNVTVEDIYVESNADDAGFIELVEGLGVDDVVIRDNQYDNGGSGWAGILIETVNNCRIYGNKISGGGGELTADSAIRVDAGASNVFDLDIRDNSLVGSFQFSVVMTPDTGNIGRFTLVDNECSDDIRFLPGGGVFSNSPLVHGNWGFGNGLTAADYSNLPNQAVCIGGEHFDGAGSSSFSGTQWLGVVNPEAESAIGTLTLAANPADTETVTLGAKTYTFQTVLTNVDGNVLIGATTVDSLQNLIAAITLGAGAGVVYAAATTANAQATAAKAPGLNMLATALVAGTAGNTIASTETLAAVGSQWSAATLLGGTQGVIGAIGDTYQRFVGSAGQVFWQKQANTGQATGWGGIAGFPGVEGAFGDLFVLPPSQSTSTIGEHIGSSVPVNGTGNIEFHVPSSFTSLIGANVIVVPGTTLSAADIDLTSDYGQTGDQFDANSEVDLTQTYPWLAGEITELDVSSVLSGIKANDTVGFVLDNNSVTGGYIILGFHFEYR
jgi:hypothetical protein